MSLTDHIRLAVRQWRRLMAFGRNSGRLLASKDNIVAADLRIVRGASLRLRSRASVGERGYVMAHVTCGEATMISANVSFVGRDHPYKVVSGLLRDEPTDFPVQIVIGADCLIGFGATLVGPLTVGDGAIVGAGAVVSKDIPPRAIVVGNPARQIGTR